MTCMDSDLQFKRIFGHEIYFFAKSNLELYLYADNMGPYFANRLM